MNQQRILLVEDDNVSRLMLEIQLQKAGYAVVGVGSGERAIHILAGERFDLLVTNLHLGATGGMQVLEAARTIDPQIEVIILTSVACAHSAIAALNLHVHSYLLKPVHTYELLYSVSDALARRRVVEQGSRYHTGTSEHASAPVLYVGPLRIDPYRHRVTHGNQALPLTSAEFSLLMYLAHRRGAVVSAQEIAREVLRCPCTPQEARDLTKGHIHRLRQKIEPPEFPLRLIHSVRGAGYRLAEDDEIEGA